MSLSGVRSYLSLKNRMGSGRKRSFGLFGGLNVLATNLLLQGLLLVTTASIATLCSQAFNAICGYYLYGKMVFKTSHMGYPSFVKFLGMSLILWMSNWIGISLASAHGMNKNIAAIVLIPVLAATSYILQRNWVFRSRHRP